MSTPKVLVSPQLMLAAQTTVYTSPTSANGGKGTYVDFVSVQNYSATASNTYSLSIVPSADTIGNQHLVINTKSVASKTTDMGTEVRGRYLAPGDAISVIAGTVTTMNIAITGRELT